MNACHRHLLPWIAGGVSSLPDVDVPTRGAWGDRGDGTYSNPVLPADFSDLDAIRVGKGYYALSATFQFSPGEAGLLWTVPLENRAK